MMTNSELERESSDSTSAFKKIAILRVENAYLDVSWAELTQSKGNLFPCQTIWILTAGAK